MSGNAKDSNRLSPAGGTFVKGNRQWIGWKHVKVLPVIARCRTAALGGHLDECTRCAHRAPISYNSCRDRHCPKCQTAARERWIAARRRELLPTRYLYVVFTLPATWPQWCCRTYVLQYLGRYTHRVAISNHRLVSFVDGQVTFRWRDSADHNKQKSLPLPVDEFLSRFLLHILPQGFVRIRHFGILANRRRTKLLPLCLQLLGSTPEPLAEEHASSTEDTPDLYCCPKCGGPMKVIERLTAAEIQLRSPPVVTAAA
jgi:Putative transposase/Transposase zinc-binding domain